MLWSTLLGAALGFALLPLMLEGLYSWCGWLAKWLVHRSAQVAPTNYSERYQRERLPDLDVLSGRHMPEASVALGVLAYAAYIPQALRPLHNTIEGQAPAVIDFPFRDYVVRLIASGLLIVLRLILVLIVLAVLALMGPRYILPSWPAAYRGGYFTLYSTRGLQLVWQRWRAGSVSSPVES
jgi:hypothetical protein